MPLRIVWLSGWAGAGKDTMAAILCGKYGYTRVAFADSLKDYCAAKYSFDRGRCDTPDGKNSVVDSQQKTVRQILIEESAEAKKQNINVFASAALAKIGGKQLFVISDWRFPHEFDCISSALPLAQHIRVRITREGLVALKDPSEHALDDATFDTNIINTCLKRLEEDVIKFLADFK
jgi:hypothetical protein